MVGLFLMESLECLHAPARELERPMRLDGLGVSRPPDGLPDVDGELLMPPPKAASRMRPSPDGARAANQG